MKRIKLALILLVAACGERAAFRPTENVVAEGTGGQPAAAYEIRSEPGEQPRATVQVWSRGATRNADRTYVDLTLSVRNTGNAPIQLASDALLVQAFTDEGAPLPDGQLIDIDPRRLDVAPDSVRDFRVRFALPSAVDPDRIGSLRLRWALLHDQGGRYVQFTDFRRIEEAPSAVYVSYYDPMFGFYDPFWYPHSFQYRVPVQRVIVHDHVRDHRPPRAARR